MSHLAPIPHHGTGTYGRLAPDACRVGPDFAAAGVLPVALLGMTDAGHVTFANDLFRSLLGEAAAGV